MGTLGRCLGMGGSSVWGLYPVLAKRMMHKYSALKTMTYASLFGTIFLLIVGLNGVLTLTWSEIPFAAWGSMFYSIALVMAHMYAVPAVAVITAAIILREQVHLMQGVGAVVIYLGISMIRKDKFSVL